MDRNQATGLFMIGLLFLVYFFFFAPEPPVQPEELPNRPDSTLAEIATPSQQIQAVDDSATLARKQAQYGPYAAGMQGNAQEIVLENENLQITFNTQGGRISRVWLKEYETYNGQPLTLIDDQYDKLKLLVDAGTAEAVDLQTLYYQASQETRQGEEGSTQVVRFSLQLANGQSVVQEYSLPAKGYTLGYRLQAPGLSQPLKLEWDKRMEHVEHDLNDSRMRSTLNYLTAEEDFDELDKQTEGVEETSIEQPVRWFGFNQRFFTTSLIADEEPFTQAYLKSEVPALDTTVVKHGQARLQLAPEALADGADFRFFFGPNNYFVLKDVAEDFDRNVNLGYFILRPINKYLIIYVFNFLERFISNYGLIIFLLVLFIKLLLFPLSYKSYLGMAKMRVVKPQLDKLKEKYGDDMGKMQQEQMKLYSQMGINPISGCVPMLLQMPILFAMFYFFPNSVELRQESFLWATDLSTYDTILKLPFTIPAYGDHVSLFTLLMTISTLGYTYISQQSSAMTAPGPMKYMSYFMPVAFLFFLNSFPAALTYYYFLSNLITIGQQLLIRRFVDDEKVLAKIERDKAKAGSGKKSRFQERLEAAMRASEEAKRQAEQGRKPKK
jgi:YidC/Oxa1 family membrane protein insertase